MHLIRARRGLAVLPALTAVIIRCGGEKGPTRPAPPPTLAFVVQPSAVACDQPITPAVQVAVQDAAGNTVTAATDAVTVELGANPGGGTLSGMLTVAATQGLATFSTLRINRPASGYTLAASAPGLTGAVSAPFAIAAVLEQQQLIYDGGLSARTLPGYTVWQSFTPGISGTLTEIDMGFFNDMSGSGQLQILAGDGTSGQVLQTLTVPVQGITRPGVTWNSWAVNTPVHSGSHYTFNFIPDAARLPDPYGVAVGAGNPYPGGVHGVDDPSGSYRTDFDLVFRTFVTCL